MTEQPSQKPEKNGKAARILTNILTAGVGIVCCIYLLNLPLVESMATT